MDRERGATNDGVPYIIFSSPKNFPPFNVKNSTKKMDTFIFIIFYFYLSILLHIHIFTIFEPKLF